MVRCSTLCTPRVRRIHPFIAKMGTSTQQVTVRVSPISSSLPSAGTAGQGWSRLLVLPRHI